MAKKRRETRKEREWKKKMHQESGSWKREYYKQKYNELIEKNEIENLDDFYYLYMGLTPGMKRIAVIDCIVRLNKIDNMTPRQIVAFLKKKEA